MTEAEAKGQTGEVCHTQPPSVRERQALSHTALKPLKLAIPLKPHCSVRHWFRFHPVSQMTEVRFLGLL